MIRTKKWLPLCPPKSFFCPAGLLLDLEQLSGEVLLVGSTPLNRGVRLWSTPLNLVGVDGGPREPVRPQVCTHAPGTTAHTGALSPSGAAAWKGL